MEQEGKDSKPFLQKAADKLVSVQQEIDELVVQFALGKAEAKEKFEDVKREFRIRIAEFKKAVENSADEILTNEMKQKLDELEVQLALGKAETVDAFEKQKKNILKVLANLESTMKSVVSSVKVPHHLQHDVETFKLKLEIIRLKFELKKFELTDKFKEQMGKAKQQVDKITMSIQEKLREKSSQYSDFKDEISLSYDHIKKALKSLVKD